MKAEAFLTLSTDDREPPILDAALKPGSVTALFEVAAGELEAFMRDGRVALYIAAGVPVIVAFELRKDAAEARRRLYSRRGSVQ